MASASAATPAPAADAPAPAEAAKPHIMVTAAPADAAKPHMAVTAAPAERPKGATPPPTSGRRVRRLRRLSAPSSASSLAPLPEPLTLSRRGRVLSDAATPDTAVLDPNVLLRWEEFGDAAALSPDDSTIAEYKLHIRRGLPAAKRAAWWQFLCERPRAGGDSLDIYAAALRHARDLDATHSLPAFCAAEQFVRVEYDEETLAKVKRLLFAVGHRITHCRQLPSLACLFVHLMPEDVAFACLESLIASTRHTFLVMTHHEMLLTAGTFSALVQRRLKRLHRHLTSIEQRQSVDLVKVFYINWMQWIYDCLPWRTLVRAMDSFLYEGIKVYYRAALALLALASDALFRATTMSEADRLIRQAAANQVEPDALLNRAFRLQLSRVFISRLYEEQVARLAASSADSLVTPESSSELPSVEPASDLMEDWQVARLWEHIPARHRLHNLHCLFAASRDGYHLNTLYDKCGTRKPLLLLVQTTGQCAIVGAFLSCPLNDHSRRNSVLGSGECFVFTLVPTMAVYRWVGDVKDNLSVLEHQFVSAQPALLGVGGAEDGFSLWLDKTFNGGSSQGVTFPNPPLTALDTTPPATSIVFSCKDVQVYGFFDRGTWI